MLSGAMAEETTWEEYVASWPPWRDFEACRGMCAQARVCGRARVCVDAHPDAYTLVCALARLSAQADERPPPRTRG